MSDGDRRGAKIITFRSAGGHVETGEMHERRASARESYRNPSGVINAFLIAAQSVSSSEEQRLSPPPLWYSVAF